MKFTIVFLIFFFLNLDLLSGQCSKTLIVNVQDVSGNPLIGASVLIRSNNQTMVSNTQGQFDISLNQDGFEVVEIYYMGYKRCIDTLKMTTDGHFEIVLEPENLTLQEVVISDNYVDRLKKEESLNIEVVNDEYLMQNLGGSLMKSLERLPGVSTIDIGSGLSKPVIRGLSFNRVLIVENGIRHESQQWGVEHGLEIDQFAVEKIEVIKGPSSIIYGSDAIGGVINIRTANVPENNVLHIESRLVGKTNNDFLGTSVSLGLRRNAMFFNFRSSISSYGDYKVPTDSVEIYSYKAPLFKHHLRNTAGNEQNLHLTIGLIKSKWQSKIIASNVVNRNGFFANAHGLEPRNVDINLHDQSNRDFQFPYHWVKHFKIINETRIFLNTLELTSHFGFQQNNRQEWSDYVSHGYMPAIFPDTLGFDADLEKQFLKEIFSVNVLLSSSQQKKLKMMVGVSGDHQNNKIGGRSFLIPSYKQYSAGSFLHASYEINDFSRMQMGIRYDYGFISTDLYLDWFPSPVIDVSDTTWVYMQRSGSTSRMFSNISWSLGYNYYQKSWIVKANLGKSFRMPIAKELSANGVNYHHFSYEVGNADLSPEVSYQLDLGVEFDSKSLAIGASPFINYFTNYIYLNPAAEHDRLYGNGNQVYYYTQSQVLRYGGEVHTHYKISQPIQIGVIGEYLHVVQTTGTKKGFSLPFTPPASLILNFKYNFNETKSLKKAYFILDYNVIAAQTLIVPPEEVTKGYQTIDLSVGNTFRIGKQDFILTIHGNNMLNKMYYNHTNYYRLINVPEAGRNFIFTLTIPITIKLNKT